jgi:hypothetical protein
VEQVLPGSVGVGEEMAQTMHTHVSKCKMIKIFLKELKKN